MSEENPSHHAAGIALMVGAALCWSLGGILIKWVQWNPMAISGVRSFIAAVVVYAAFPRIEITFSRLQVAGAIAYAATMITFVAATKWTTAANAILLQYTAPVWVALFSHWFLGERTKRSDLAALFVVMGGMVLFFLDRLTMGGMVGNLTAVLSGFCFGWLILMTRRQAEASPLGSVLLGNLLAGLVGLPWMFTGPYPDVYGWTGLALLGIVQLGLAYILFVLGIRRLRAVEASLILLLEPVLNPIWVLLLIGERPGPMAAAGGAVILGTLALRSAVPLVREGSAKGGEG